MSVLLKAVNTEKVMRLFEQEKKMLFDVDRRATKEDIRKEVEQRFNVKVKHVRTLITPTGKKRAWITVEKDADIQTLASKFKLI